MAMDRTWIGDDDDGSGETGTVVNEAYITALCDAIDDAIAAGAGGTVPTGGTGVTTLTNHGVVIGQGTSPVAVTGAGTAGQPLVSGGASANPAFGTATVPGGGTGVATLTAHGVLIGEGTSAVAVTAAGTAGQVLTSGGASADPAWAAAAGGKPFLQWDALGNRPPASAGATPDTRNAHWVLNFDGATDEEAVFAGVLAPNYAAGGITVDTYWGFATATTGSLRVQAGVERIDVSSLDIDADSFASFQSTGGSAPATSGMVIKVPVVFTDGAQMDSLAAGEAFRLKIRRDADGTSGTDDIATDAQLLRVVLRET